MKYRAGKVEIADWQKYKKIRLEALKNDPQAFSSFFGAECKLGDEEWQERLASGLCKKNKKIFIGVFDETNNFVAIGGAFTREDAREWCVVAVYVAPECRRRGIGKVLLSAIIAELKKIGGVEKLVLRVNRKQRPAVKLYKSFGFAIEETIKDQIMGDGEFHDEYEMIKAYN
jgi:ribosomal protein S18 acetylase RimI-like enzyme